jgi:hypothetical protein
MLSKYCSFTDEKLSRSIKLLEKTSTKHFKIGSNIEFQLPGHFDIIILNTPIFDYLFNNEKDENNIIDHIAPYISIPEDERSDFCVVWLFLNGYLTADTILPDNDKYSLTNLMNIYKWMNYFNIDKKSWFYDTYYNDFIKNKIKMFFEYRDIFNHIESKLETSAEYKHTFGQVFEKEKKEKQKEEFTYLYDKSDKYSLISVLLAILLKIKSVDHFKNMKNKRELDEEFDVVKDKEDNKEKIADIWNKFEKYASLKAEIDNEIDNGFLNNDDDDKEISEYYDYICN